MDKIARAEKKSAWVAGSITTILSLVCGIAVGIFDPGLGICVFLLFFLWGGLLIGFIVSEIINPVPIYNYQPGGGKK